MEIKIINRENIDIIKWNQCIDNAKNGFVYAYSWFLDVTAKKKWRAIVLGDYEFVMPFAENKKYFIKYIYQPFFTQQLGVFSEKEIISEIVDIFLQELLKSYKFINTNLNYVCKTNTVTLQIRDNFELKLRDIYDVLYTNFSKNAKTYLKKAEKNSLQITHDITINDIIQLKRNKENINLNNENLDLLEQLLTTITKNTKFEIYGAKNQKDDLISASFYVLSHNKAYYIFSESNEEGRAKFASFFLINQFIKEHAGQNLILDFEGSMIPGVARFFKGWGAKNNPYYNLKQNNLPLFLKFLKK